MQQIIVLGNPVAGFTYVGPFEDEDAATEYADGFIDDDWWLAELAPPATE